MAAVGQLPQVFALGVHVENVIERLLERAVLHAVAVAVGEGEVEFAGVVRDGQRRVTSHAQAFLPQVAGLEGLAGLLQDVHASAVLSAELAEVRHVLVKHLAREAVPRHERDLPARQQGVLEGQFARGPANLLIERQAAGVVQRVEFFGFLPQGAEGSGVGGKVGRIGQGAQVFQQACGMLEGGADGVGRPGLAGEAFLLVGPVGLDRGAIGERLRRSARGPRGRRGSGESEKGRSCNHRQQQMRKALPSHGRLRLLLGKAHSGLRVLPQLDVPEWNFKFSNSLRLGTLSCGGPRASTQY
ncbi:MAG: hypothetical protein NT049_07965 [Planctomycetota bacterium]|nr:hypothetical protein [Planctomycetota bacterium]